MTKKDDMHEDDIIDDDDMLDEERDYIELTLEDDTVITCVVEGIFELEDERYSGKMYIALQDVDSDDVLLYQYTEDDDGEFDLIPIVNDFELMAVSEEFERLAEQEFDE